MITIFIVACTNDELHFHDHRVSVHICSICNGFRRFVLAVCLSLHCQYILTEFLLCCLYTRILQKRKQIADSQANILQSLNTFTLRSLVFMCV